MKKLKLTKTIASLLVAASISGLNPVVANAEWKHDSKGWWYANGSSWYKGWNKIDGKWYFFNKNGYMQHDGYIDNYYLNSDGHWNGAPQEFSVKYPSSWTKSVDELGYTTYLLDNKRTFVSSETEIMHGQSIENHDKFIIDEIKKESSIDKVDLSKQVINGKTVSVLNCKAEYNGITVVMQLVVFYNNNKAYIFILGEMNEISTANLYYFDEMLETVTF